MNLTYIFDMVKNMQTTEYGMNGIHDLSKRQHKRTRICESVWMEIVEASFPVNLCNF